MLYFTMTLMVEGVIGRYATPTSIPPTDDIHRVELNQLKKHANFLKD